MWGSRALLSFCVLTLWASAEAMTVLHEWVTLQYLWRSPTQESQYQQEGLWTPENCALAGVKAYQGQFYATVPRWKSGWWCTKHQRETGQGDLFILII